MPFPFLPGGAILAIAVLGGALTIFGLALTALDRAAGRAIVALGGSMLPGIVSGWRGWQGSQGPPPDPGSPEPGRPLSPSTGAALEIIDLD